MTNQSIAEVTTRRTVGRARWVNEPGPGPATQRTLVCATATVQLTAMKDTPGLGCAIAVTMEATVLERSLPLLALEGP